MSFFFFFLKYREWSKSKQKGCPISCRRRGLLAALCVWGRPGRPDQIPANSTHLNTQLWLHTNTLSRKLASAPHMGHMSVFNQSLFIPVNTRGVGERERAREGREREWRLQVCGRWLSVSHDRQPEYSFPCTFIAPPYYITPYSFFLSFCGCFNFLFIFCPSFSHLFLSFYLLFYNWS